MKAIAIDVTTSTSGLAESGSIKFGLVVTGGSTEATTMAPGFVKVCGTSDIALGLADDDVSPKTTAEYYNVRDFIRVLQTGCRARGWLASGNAITKGWWMKLAADGELAPESRGDRTVTSFCQAMESKSSSASSQQIELIIA